MKALPYERELSFVEKELYVVYLRSKSPPPPPPPPPPVSLSLPFLPPPPPPPPSLSFLLPSVSPYSLLGTCRLRKQWKNEDRPLRIQSPALFQILFFPFWGCTFIWRVYVPCICAYQVRLTVGGSGLWCWVRVTSFECWLTPLFSTTQVKLITPPQ